jgi:hypothetical protein
MRRHLGKCEKIFVRYSSDRRLISRLYEELKTLSINSAKIPINKRMKEHN